MSCIIKIYPCNNQFLIIFSAVKIEKFHWKKFNISINILAQNIDCGYTLEPPHPVNPSFAKGGIHYQGMLS